MTSKTPLIEQIETMLNNEEQEPADVSQNKSMFINLSYP